MKVLRVSVGVLAVGLALAACGGDPDRRDGGRPDAPITPADTGPPVDTGPLPDGTVPTDRGGPGRTCMGPAGGMCDVLAQDCGGTNGCYYAGMAGGGAPNTTCVMGGTGGDGDACTNANDCQPGLVCTSGNVCRRYCCMGDASLCASGQICVGVAMAGDIGICNAIDGCTLAPQGGCDAGEGCWPVAEDGSTSCFPAGTTAVGATCDALNDCVAGAGCYSTMAGGTFSCLRFCRVGMDGDCMGSGTCMAAGGLPTGIGICVGG